MPKPLSLQIQNIFRNSVLNNKIKRARAVWVSQQQDLALLSWGFDPVERHSGLLLPLIGLHLSGSWRASVTLWEPLWGKSGSPQN